MQINIDYGLNSLGCSRLSIGCGKFYLELYGPTTNAISTTIGLIPATSQQLPSMVGKSVHLLALPRKQVYLYLLLYKICFKTFMFADILRMITNNKFYYIEKPILYLITNIIAYRQIHIS